MTAYRNILATALLWAGTLATTQAQPTAGNPVAAVTDPAVVFRHPPEAAKPGVLWMWMGANLSKEGITKDLEALKKRGSTAPPCSAWPT